MKTAICTISTKSHLFKSKTTLGSITSMHQIDLFCLVTDVNDYEDETSINYKFISQLESIEAKELIRKYKNDKLRWSLKSVFTKFLLENGYDQVMYVDNDIFFYSSPDFIFEKLRTSSFLITPHFYKSNPNKDQNWLEANYRVGLYNAGFFSVNKSAIPILDWWTKCCLYNVKKAYWRGLYDDQKYLDLVPIIFENVEVLKHRGCNFAGWNCDEVALNSKDQELYINDDKIVFIHFAQLSMERFSDPKSKVHIQYTQYLNALKSHHSSFEFRGKKRSLLSFSVYFYYLRWKLVRLFEN